MIVTVCELPDNRPEFGESWTQLVEHINQAGSGTVVLPGMAFSRWFASGLRQRGWIRWRQACPTTILRMRHADESRLLLLLVALIAHAAAAHTGLPRYDRVLVLDQTAETSANVSIGDVNGDGHPDLVIAKGRHWPLMSLVFLGDGTGHFAAGYDLAEKAYRSYSANLVDLDGNGTLDVALSNDAPDPNLVYLNDGKGHFRAGSPYGQAEWPTRNVTIADLNGDKLPDIVVANRSEAVGNFICINKGDAQFGGDCIQFSTASATTITAADVNRDGLIDLIVPYRDGGQSYVYLAGPGATYSESRRIPFAPPDATIRMIQAADLNRDGLLDFVAIDDEHRSVAVYFGRKGGKFSSAVAIDNGAATPNALALADLNRDGRIDVIVGNVGTPSTVFFNDGTGRHYTPVHFVDGEGAVFGLAIADLDGNGLPDIAVARSNAANVVCFATAPSVN